MKREREREDGAERQRDERKEGHNKKNKKKEGRMLDGARIGTYLVCL